MATDLERLVVQLGADVRGFQTELLKANGIANRQARAIEKRFWTMNKTLDGFGKSAARSLVAPLAGVTAALSVREVLQYADAWTKAKNSLAVAGVTGRKQKQVLDQLFASAQRNGAPVGALAELFGKAAQASDNLGAKQGDLIRFADGVATALKVQSTGAQEASGALTQLGQLLGSARVQAEEFNSVGEGARPILIAVANGLDAAGGSVNKLKLLVNDGKVSGKQFFDAFLRGLPAIQSMAANSTQTIEQGVTKVNNAFTKYIGESDSSLGASQRLAVALNALADNFDMVADVTLMFAGIIAGALVGRSLVGMIAKLGLATSGVIKLVTALRAASNLRGITAAFGGLGAAAGPIGAIVGIAAAGALEIYASRATEAASRSERVTAELEKMGIAGHKAAEGIDAVSDAQSRLPTAEAISENSDKVRDFTDEVKALQAQLSDALVPFYAIGQPLNLSLTGDGARKITELTEKYGDGKIAIEEFHAALDAVARAQPNFAPAIASIKALTQRLYEAATGLDVLSKAGGDSLLLPNRRAGIGADHIALAAQQAEGRSALADASKEFKMTDGEKRLATEMERLRKAIEKDHPGAIVSDAQIRGQAQRNLGLSDLNQTIDSYVNDVVKAEGTGKNPSSSADGFGNFITSTWLDLFKRYFPDRARGMADAAILALRHDEATGRTLIEAYARENAAVLQKAGVTVTEAALQLSHFLGAGDAAKVFNAAPGTPLKGLISQSSINANPTILGGGRTVDDAIAYAQSRVGQATPGAAKFDTNQGFDAYLAQEKQSLDMLRQEAALRQQLGPIVEGNSAALLAFQQAQMLLSQAQQGGAAVGLELHDVNQLLYGDLTGLSPAAREQAEAMRALALDYANTQVAGEQLAESQAKLKERTDSFNEIGRDALGTFISDLREGKSAAEALGDVLDNIADKLVNMALDALFSSGASGGGGIGGWIGKLFGLKDGGAVHAASGGQIRGPGTSRSDSIPAMLSDGEFVVNAAATGRHRRLLEAINSGKALHLAAGSFVGAPAIPRAAGGPSLNFAPTYQIDASGSQMSEQQFRSILQENNKHVVRDVRQKVSGWVAYDQRRFGQ